MNRSIKLLTFFAFLIVLTGAIACDNDDNQSPTAVLTASESTLVPGRIVLDGSMSFDNDGVIISYTFSIEDSNGDTVAGPETSFDVPEGSKDSFILPAGDYMAFLTVTDDNGDTSTAEAAISHDSEVFFGDESINKFSLETMTKLPTNNTCSRSSGGTLITCVLGTGSSSVDLSDLVNLLKNHVNPGTIFWIQAWGATGGNGTSQTADGGVSGRKGFAQMSSQLENFSSRFGTSTIFYYIGQQGTHDSSCGQSGGQGGQSTLVTVKNLETTSTSDLNRDDDVVLIAGGAGGGGGATGLAKGHDGRDGGTAISALCCGFGPTIGAGGSGSQEDGDNCTGGSSSGDGAGGASGDNFCFQCNATGGTDGIGGTGGKSSCLNRNNDWLNGTPQTGANGTGGNASTAIFNIDGNGGGGGGGYGGGGGNVGNDHRLFKCDSIDGQDCPGFGGCGGGSYAAAVFFVTDAPNSYVANTDSGDGEVLIVFDP